jgi:hypothetical protein
VKSAANLGTTQLETDARGEAIATGLPAARVIVNVKKASADAVPLDPATAGLQASMEALQKQITAGSFSPIVAPIVIRARAADGRIVAEQRIDPGAALSDAVTPVPGDSGPCNVRLTIPAEPLEFEVSGAGYEAARTAWQPNREDDSGDVLIFALRES